MLGSGSGCYTGLSADSDADPSSDSGPGGPGGSDSTPTGSDSDTPGTDSSDPTEDSDTDDDPEETSVLPQTSRFPRLSHTQWENTVRDLLLRDEPTGHTNLFIGDPISGGFDNNSEALKVTATLWTDYQRAAEAVAEAVAKDEALVLTLAPEVDGDSDARARAFITSFGLKAYRRPLTDDEVDRHVQVFQSGVSVPGDLDGFAAGLRLVMQAMLQSPHFLYRIEASEVIEGNRIRLNDYELASKLSYMLWNTMPDDELFTAAAAKSLQSPAGIAAQAQRMLDDPRARDMVAAYHHQLLHIDHYAGVYKSPERFPHYSPDMNAMMATETSMFVQDVVFNEEGDLSQLLTAPYTFVNSVLAPLYGLEGEFGPEFVRTELNPAQRAGILTQIGFLSANAGAFENDPIHRGVFMNLALLCTGLPPPPDLVPPLPPPVEGETLRERVDRHTGKGTCGEGCHGYLINPLGFAFEQYNPLGEWQTMDAGKPVDATAEFMFGGEAQTFDGAVELAQQMADSIEAHRCYVAHLLEYGYARTPQTADQKFITKVAEGSREGELSIKKIILELTKSDAFMYRAPVEE